MVKGKVRDQCVSYAYSFCGRAVVAIDLSAQNLDELESDHWLSTGTMQLLKLNETAYVSRQTVLRFASGPCSPR